jgi:hypothetical protein
MKRVDRRAIMRTLSGFTVVDVPYSRPRCIGTVLVD